MAIEDRKRARRLSISNRELLIATTESDLKSIDNLLETDVDVDFKDRDGNAALHWAVECGNVKAVELLLSKGASLHSKNNKAETPLDVGKRLNNKHIIDILSPPKPPQNKEVSSNESKSETSLTPASEIQNNEAQKINDNMLERRQNSVHGNIYQLKLLMLFLYRGVSHKYSFRLGTEIREAMKFDDLVFEYDVNGRQIFRFLQAKHRLDESKKINAENLLKDNDGDYSLVKYFFSYLMLRKDELFNGGSVKDVTVCTNINFDIENLESNGITVEKIVEKDEILDVNSERKESARYKFSEGIVQILKSKLQSFGSPRFRKKNIYMDSDIAEFVNCLVFAVNQPNEDELGNIVKHEMSKEFDFATAEIEYNKFFVSMLNWLHGKEKGAFLSYEDGKEFFVEFKKNIKLWFGVRGPIESFSGRSKFLKNLHKILLRENTIDGKSQFVCISGLGGVGKSELTRKYISTYSQDFDNKIVWINAESYESLANSFRRLASDKLKISTVSADNKEKKLNSIVEDVYAFFSDKKSLFIFDNAEKYKSKHEFDDGIEAFLPNLPDASNRPHVLITSRNQKWPNNVKVLSLNVFSENEAMEFVKKSLNLQDNDQIEEITKLVNELQFLPLALQQSVAYIGSQDEKLKSVGSKFKISNYLKKYEQKTKEYFKFTDDNENDYSKTTYSTWNVTFDAIRQKDDGAQTCEILEILSYFAPTEISVQTITSLIRDNTKLASAFDLLKQYSIINVKNEMLSMHRLVIKVVRLHLEDQNREQAILRKALDLFSPATLTLENIEHAISVWNHSSKYCKLIDEFASLPSHIIKMLLNSWRYEEAELFGIKASKQLDVLTSKSHTTKHNFIETKEYTASALACRGKYELSVKYYEDIYKVQKRIFGPNSFEALESRKKISVLLMYLGQYERASELCEDIIKIESKTLGKNHLNTSYTLHNKALILNCQGKYKEALSLLKEVLGIRELLLENNHPDTLTIKNDISKVLSNLHKFSEATKVEQEVSILKEKNNKYLPDKMLEKADIAIGLSQQGKFKEAFIIFKEAYEDHKKILGEDHPNSMMIQRNIGEALKALEKFDEALEILNQVYKKQKKILGPDSPDTILTVNSIGYTLCAQNKLTEALKILQDSLEKCNIVLGRENPSTMRVINSIAVILTQQRKYDESLKYSRQILEIQEKNLGDDHNDTLSTRHNIATALFEAGQLDEALKLYKEICSKEKDSTHPDSISTKKNMLLILTVQSKLDEALKLSRELLEAQEKAFGKRHRETFLTKVTMVELLNRANKSYSALKLLREISETANDDILNVIGIDQIRNWMQGVETEIGLLFSVIRRNDPEELQTLFDYGRDVNSADKYESTLLHYAAANGQNKIVEVLLKNGSDVTLVNIKGDTALHEAAANGSLNIIKVLLKCGSVYDMRNNKNATALDLCKNESARRLLKSVGEIFENAAKGDTRILEKLKNLQTDELEAVQKTRNTQGKTFLQLIILHRYKDLSNKVLDIIRGNK